MSFTLNTSVGRRILCEMMLSRRAQVLCRKGLRSTWFLSQCHRKSYDILSSVPAGTDQAWTLIHGVCPTVCRLILESGGGDILELCHVLSETRLQYERDISSMVWTLAHREREFCLRKLSASLDLHQELSDMREYLWSSPWRKSRSVV